MIFFYTRLFCTSGLLFWICSLSKNNASVKQLNRKRYSQNERIYLIYQSPATKDPRVTRPPSSKLSTTIYQIILLFLTHESFNLLFSLVQLVATIQRSLLSPIYKNDMLHLSKVRFAVEISCFTESVVISLFGDTRRANGGINHSHNRISVSRPRHCRFAESV